MDEIRPNNIHEISDNKNVNCPYKMKPIFRQTRYIQLEDCSINWTTQILDESEKNQFGVEVFRVFVAAQQIS